MEHTDTPQNTDKEQNPESGNSAYDVLVAVRRIIRAVNVQSKWVAKKCGLTTPQVVILQAVRDLGEVTAARVAEQVDLSPATVATVMDRLEKRDLIERYRSDTDRRIVHSRLTPFGQKSLDKAPPLLSKNFIDTFSGLKSSDQKKAIQTLEYVAQMLNGDDNDAEPHIDPGASTARSKK